MKQIVRAKTEKKEGHNSLEEFHRALIEIDGNWDSEQIVTVYEFKVVYRGDWTPPDLSPLLSTKKRTLQKNRLYHWLQ